MEPPDLDTSLVVEQLDDVTVTRFTREVVLSGKLADAVGDAWMSLLSAPGQTRLLLDFANVASLSSLILAKLVNLNRKAESLKGRLALCNLRPDIREIMSITRLSHLLCIYPEEQEALKSF